MVRTVSRIINGFRMLWATLLVNLRYPLLIGFGIIINLINDSAQPYLAEISSSALYVISLFAMYGCLTFVNIAAMKYLAARLDKIQHLYRPLYRSYYFFVDTAKRSLIPVLLLAALITGITEVINRTSGTTHIITFIIVALIATTCFFVPALIAEGKDSFHQLVPESTRLFIKYWPEIVGNLALLTGITFLLYSLLLYAYPQAHITELDQFFASYPSLTLLGIFTYPIVLQVILLREDRGQHVGEEFAFYFPGSKA